MTFPLVGLSNNPIMFNNVDFPEPELPTIKTNSPRLMLNETLSNALPERRPHQIFLKHFVVLKQYQTFLIASTGCSLVAL